MPLAVYGGRAEIMKSVAPLGPVYQAGTLSGNPVAVSAGLATLEQLTPAVYEKLEALGAQLQEGIERGLREHQVTGCVQRVGSMITLFFHSGPVRCYRDASASDVARFAAWHQALRARGVYWPPSQFEAAFISAAHSPDDIDFTISAMGDALAALSHS